MFSVSKQYSSSVQDLTYTVKSKSHAQGRLTLLKGISGCFEPGQMSALVRVVCCSRPMGCV